MHRLRTLLLLALLVLTGCSGSSDSGTAGSGGGTGQPTGTVVTNFTLLRAVPSNITDFRFFFFNSGGNVVFGPVTVAKASQVTLTGVPTAAVSMRIEYLQSGVLRGIGVSAITVTQGGTTVVNDPPFQDVGSQVQAVTVTPIEDSAPVGTNVQYVATALFFDGQTQDVTSSATWTSSDEGVATVSNSTGTHGRATAAAVGSANITATYGGVAGAGSLDVRAAVLVRLLVEPNDAAIARGTTQPFRVVGLFSDGSTEDLTRHVNWTTADPSIATIDDEGVATGVDTGATSVRATDPVSGVTDTSSLVVTAAVLQRIEVTPVESSVAVGHRRQFIATGVYSDLSSQNITSSVTWTSSDPTVATVSNAAGEDGLATGIRVGSAFLSAEMPGTGVVGSGLLQVTAATLESIEVFPASPVVADGEDLQFTAIGVFSDSTTVDLTRNVLWSSSNEAVAHVTNAAGYQGFTMALSVGQATIEATDRNSGVSGSTVLTVGAATLQSITVTPGGASVSAGAEVPYTAFGTYSDASVRNITSLVTWTSSLEEVASISNQPGSVGVATANAFGVAQIQATLGTVSGSTQLSVTPATLVSLEVTPVNPSLPNGMQRQFTATGTYSDASTQDLTQEVTWASSAPAIATVSNAPGSEGLTTADAVGVTTITAEMPGTGISGSTPLSVTAAVLQSITVTPGNQTVSPATIIPYTANGNFSDGSTLDLTSAVTWRSSNRLSALISNHPFTKGVAISVLPGTTTISARLPNSAVVGTTGLNVQ